MCLRSRVSTVHVTWVALTSGPLKALSCATWLMLAPHEAITLQSSARPPGRSLILTVKRVSRPSWTRPFSITRPRMTGSMLPPPTTTLFRSAYLDREARESSVVDKTLLDYPAQDDGIDVASADNQRDAFSPQALDSACQHRRKRRGRRALDHHLFEFKHPEDRHRNPLFLDARHTVHPASYEAKRVFADGQGGQPVRKGCAPGNAHRAARLERRG